MTTDAIELELGRPFGSLIFFWNQLKLPKGLPNSSLIASAVIFAGLWGEPRSGEKATSDLPSPLPFCLKT
jgi:hypothetical protein